MRIFKDSRNRQNYEIYKLIFTGLSRFTRKQERSIATAKHPNLIMRKRPGFKRKVGQPHLANILEPYQTHF